MKIVLTAKGKEWDSKIDPRFGRTEYIFIYNEDSDKIDILDNTAVASEAHGVGPKTAQKIFEANADVLITGNGPGGNAKTVLESGNLNIFVGAGNMTLKEAYDAYKKDKLKKF
ncbi:MAG: NifB/NifX family molybdenum-iron cluster-binding protein [Candidatus Marinimicrobia bacterium]|nr:NifB/NifX family molybdenum-iron cluster-binding protein [Candidatus Neomarinimicrobiota bacterium]